jgi:hypothetical protein
VAGQPLFLKNLNCHCFDPNQSLVFNPAAWSDPAAGAFGTGAAYYGDYRYQRQPAENFSFGRDFRLNREGKAKLNIRAEFSNIFNRSRLPNPSSTNAKATTTTNAATGNLTGGFGFINTAVAPSTPASRQGQIVGRLTF